MYYSCMHLITMSSYLGQCKSSNSVICVTVAVEYFNDKIRNLYCSVSRCLSNSLSLLKLSFVQDGVSITYFKSHLGGN